MNVLQLLFNFWKGKKSYMRSFLWDVTPVHYNYTFIPILFQGDLNVGHQDVERWRDLEGENGNIEKIQDKKQSQITPSKLCEFCFMFQEFWSLVLKGEE